MSSPEAISPDSTHSVVDIHAHLIPGVDDGATDQAETREALQRMREAGVERATATPHFNASLVADRLAFTGRMSELDAGWAQAQALAAEVGVRLERAAEVMLDTPNPDFSDERLRLAGGSFVLVEFPFLTIPPRSGEVIALIRSRGWTPIVAHPERYSGMDAELERARSWRERGAYLQLNGRSLLGSYGEDVRRLALSLLERGLVDYVASDYHARGRPRIADYAAALDELGAGEAADLLLRVNPARALDGQAPIPAGSIRVPRRRWWRIVRALGLR
jgi:tyrosine-protein phosphatase YwqE